MSIDGKWRSFERHTGISRREAGQGDGRETDREVLRAPTEESLPDDDSRVFFVAGHG